MITQIESETWCKYNTFADISRTNLLITIRTDADKGSNNVFARVTTVIIRRTTLVHIYTQRYTQTHMQAYTQTYSSVYVYGCSQSLMYTCATK